MNSAWPIWRSVGSPLDDQCEHLGLTPGQTKRGRRGRWRLGRRRHVDRFLEVEAAALGEQLDLAAQRPGPERHCRRWAARSKRVVGDGQEVGDRPEDQVNPAPAGGVELEQVVAQQRLRRPLRQSLPRGGTVPNRHTAGTHHAPARPRRALAQDCRSDFIERTMVRLGARPRRSAGLFDATSLSLVQVVLGRGWRGVVMTVATTGDCTTCAASCSPSATVTQAA